MHAGVRRPPLQGGPLPAGAEPAALRPSRRLPTGQLRRTPPPALETAPPRPEARVRQMWKKNGPEAPVRPYPREREEDRGLVGMDPRGKELSQ